MNVCLRIQPEEKVTVITDEATKEIAASIVHELEKVGCPYHAWVLEDLVPRPVTDLPQEILDDLETSQVSIFAVQAQTNELRSRMQMTDVVNRRNIRHAHMVNINHQIMLEGMRADFLKVDRISTKVVDIVRQGFADSGKNGCRDRLDRELNPNYRWLKTSGIISPDKWGNLPGGEVFTTPGEVNGTFVIDGVVGRLAVRQVRQPAGEPADYSGEGQSPGRGAFRRTANWKTISGGIPTPTKTAIGGRVCYRYEHRIERRDRTDSAG